MKLVLLLIIFINFCYADAIAQKKTNKKHKTKSALSSPEKKIIIKYGTASFYAKKFNGRQTANSEIYSSIKYSAACNVLPLNTWIKVTNLKNDKSLIVKINDRLHPKNKRLIDLSTLAAKELGYLSMGLTRVKIEVLNNFHLGTE